jgi:hypothetical protein
LIFLLSAPLRIAKIEFQIGFYCSWLFGKKVKGKVVPVLYISTTPLGRIGGVEA